MTQTPIQAIVLVVLLNNLCVVPTSYLLIVQTISSLHVPSLHSTDHVHQVVDSEINSWQV